LEIVHAVIHGLHFASIPQHFFAKTLLLRPLANVKRRFNIPHFSLVLRT
jgi:hypothetical protein